MRRFKKLIPPALGALIPALLFLVWYAATAYGTIPSVLLPSPAKVFEAFLETSRTGQLWQDLGVSLKRMSIGFGVSCALGLLLGGGMGMCKTVKRLLSPFLTALRQVPLIAWIPLTILWFGIGETSKVVMIIVAAVFPIVVNTLSGLASVPNGHLELGKLFRMNRWNLFWKISVPYALPHILSGLRMSLSISWMALIAAELLSGNSGIGYRMCYARSMMRSDVLFVCIFAVAIVGLVLDRCITLIFRRMTPWYSEEAHNV